MCFLLNFLYVVTVHIKGFAQVSTAWKTPGVQVRKIHRYHY